ncbi:hypothetical protein VTH06DRAFT_3649 [Thermothelomyces fergusii]
MALPDLLARPCPQARQACPSRRSTRARCSPSNRPSLVAGSKPTDRAWGTLVPITQPVKKFLPELPSVYWGRRPSGILRRRYSDANPSPDGLYRVAVCDRDKGVELFASLSMEAPGSEDVDQGKGIRLGAVVTLCHRCQTGDAEFAVIDQGRGSKFASMQPDDASFGSQVEGSLPGSWVPD